MSTLSQRIGYQGRPDIERWINNHRTEEEFLGALAKQSHFVLDILKGMQFSERKSQDPTQTQTPLAAKLLYQVDPKDLSPEVQESLKKIVSVLRNREALHFDGEPTLQLRDPKGKMRCPAHKSILALESPFFKRALNLCPEEQTEMEVYHQAAFEVIPWLYASDRARKEALLDMEPSTLPDIAKVASLFELDELRRGVELRLCSDLASAPDPANWCRGREVLKRLDMPISRLFLKFVEEQGGHSSVENVLRQMSDPKGAWELYHEATEEERRVFAGLSNEWGRVCQIPAGTFTPCDWRSALNFSANAICPLPQKLYEVLETPDPWEPEKKVGETFALFFMPAPLSMGQLLELSSRAPGRWKIKNRALSFEGKSDQPRWILQRKALVSLEAFRSAKNSPCRLPKPLEAMALQVAFFVRNGTRLLPAVVDWKTSGERLSLTLCHEGEYRVVGALNDSSELTLESSQETPTRKDVGIAPVWMW